MTQKDVLIRKLKNDLEYARKQQQETARELRDCELCIARLQGQIGKLQDEQTLKRSDVAAKDHTLKAMEKQHMDNKVKVSVLSLGVVFSRNAKEVNANYVSTIRKYSLADDWLIAKSKRSSWMLWI